MNLADVLQGLSALAWPALAGFVLLKLYPALHKMIESRGFTVRIGQMEVSVQEASANLQAQIADLQEKVAGLRLLAPVADTARQGGALATARTSSRILWVDDKPENNAFEIARLQDEGFDVLTATSTADGMKALGRDRAGFDIVISDMGRNESERWLPKAGFHLIEAIRNERLEIPILIYTTAKRASQDREAALAAGAAGITGSALELLETIRDLSRT